MKKLHILIVTAFVFFNFYSHCSEYIIKPATFNDLPELKNLSRTIAFDYFKPIMAQGYPDTPIAKNEQLLDNLMNEIIDGYEKDLTHVVEKLFAKNSHLLVATSLSNATKIQALCLFYKTEQQTYISYLIVDKQCRGKGIGTLLLNTAINTYPNSTSCELITLARANEKTQTFYETYGFTSTKELITLDERIPNSHIKYHLNIKK